MYFTELSFYTLENVLKYYKNCPTTMDAGLTEWGLYRTYDTGHGIEIDLIHTKLEYNTYWVKCYTRRDIEAQRLTKGIPREVLLKLKAPLLYQDARWTNIALLIN